MSLLVAACGSGSGDDDDGAGCPGELTDRFLPLEVGATWTYNVTPMVGPAETKAQTVEAFEDVGGDKAGTMAFRVRTEKIDGATVSWQECSELGVLRHREQSFDLQGNLVSDQIYDPYKLRIDETAEHLAMGASFMQTYLETETDPITGMQTSTTKTETWLVQDVAATVNCNVPDMAGATCLQVNRMGMDVMQANKTFWFARGVGKVFEAGDQTEELVSYSLP
jgi:hypothetical protein